MLIAGRQILALAVVVSILTSCTSPVPPTASPSTPSPSPSPMVGQPITIQIDSIPSLSNWVPNYAGFYTAHTLVARMVHAGLYRHDASLAAVPDLAARPCDVATDLVTITCSLREATFHDGSSVTATDVAYMFELARSPDCMFMVCLGPYLKSSKALDQRTVQFTLLRPYAPFLSTAVADLLIEPRAVIEASYAAIADRATNADPAAVEAMAARIHADLAAAEPNCASSLEAGEQMLHDVGVKLADRRLFVVPQGRGFDDCSYADYLASSLDQAATSMKADGLDAVAAAYPLLGFIYFNEKPIGAGPWRLRTYDPDKGLVLERHELHHLGPPATSEVRIRVIRDEQEIKDETIAGRLDWLPGATVGGTYKAFDVEPSVRLVTYPGFGYAALQYNVRAGLLFADRNLRQAVELCIDKERIIEAAVEGVVTVYSPVPPGSWAYQPGLAKQRDTTGARRLIEASGWTQGTDGIYEREGSRLSFEVPVRADIAPPLALLDRAALKLRDCGMELIPRPVDFRDGLAMLETFPHLMPGSSKPFDAYFGGWGMAYDPDVTDQFHSSRITTKSHAGPPYYNYVGFSDARVDQLLDDGVATYDQGRRTEIYRELQRILAQEQPYLFMSALPTVEVIDADLSSTSGELDFSSPNWWWRLETLVNPAE